MTPAIIMDIAAAGILLAATWIGRRRGLFLTLAGSVILVLAIVGANLGARALSEPLADRLTPVLQEKITARMETELAARGEQIGASLEELLPESLWKLLGRVQLQDVLKEPVEGALSEISGTIAAAVAQELAESFLYAVMYLLLFFCLLVLLRVTAHGINLILKLPLLRGVNSLGGGLIGLLEGALIVWLLLFLAPRVGVELPVEDTLILRFFSAAGSRTALSL